MNASPRQAAAGIDIDVLTRAEHCHPDPIEAAAIRTARQVIEQLLEPWLAFGEPVCRLCGESPEDNNKLRTELLATHRHATPRPIDPADAPTITELTEALRKANNTIADRNNQIAGLRKNAA